MAKVQKRTFSLPEDQSAFIDAKVAAGGYASSSEVVREGLRALQQRDAAMDRWLREDVAVEYDAWLKNPEDVLTSDQVFDAIDEELSSIEK